MASSSDPKFSMSTQTSIDVNNSDYVSGETTTKIANSHKILRRYVCAYSLQDENETNESLKNVQNEDGCMINYKQLFTIDGKTRDLFQMKNISDNDSNIINTKEMTMKRKIDHLQSMLQRIEQWELKELPVTLKAEGEKIKEEINRLIELTSDEKELVIGSTQEQNKLQVNNNKRKIVVKNVNKKNKQYQRTIIGLKAEVQRQKAIYAREKIKWEREREELQRAKNSESQLKKNQTDESSTQTSIGELEKGG